MDERSLAGDHVFTTHDHLHYVSWSNALARLLARLGLQPPAEDPTAVFDRHMESLRSMAARRAEPEDDDEPEAA
jgi:hypothetical protein